MDIGGLIVMLIVGAVAGWIAGQIMRGGGFGLLGNIGIGIVGAVIAGFILPNILPFGGILASIISATIGAIIVLWIVGMVRKKT